MFSSPTARAARGRLTTRRAALRCSKPRRPRRQKKSDGGGGSDSDSDDDSGGDDDGHGDGGGDDGYGEDDNEADNDDDADDRQERFDCKWMVRATALLFASGRSLYPGGTRGRRFSAWCPTALVASAFSQNGRSATSASLEQKQCPSCNLRSEALWWASRAVHLHVQEGSTGGDCTQV